MVLCIIDFEKLEFSLLRSNEKDFLIVSFYLTLVRNMIFLVVWIFTLPKQMLLSENGQNYTEDLSDTIIISR